MSRKLTSEGNSGIDIVTAGQIKVLVPDPAKGYFDLTEVATPASPGSNVARIFALDDGAITTVAIKDSAGNTRSLSHFKQAGTGAAVRSQIAKLGDHVSVMDFSGIDPTGATDSAAAIQAAIDAVAAIGTRGTVLIPSTRSGGDYKINTPLTWKPNVNIVCDPHARIFAGATMAALLQTDVGTSGVRLRNVWLRGGRWDGAQLARRGIWIKEGEKIHLTDFSVIAIGTYVDGVSETESAYLRIGDPAQTRGCFEVMVDNFVMYRNDTGGSSTPAPALNHGIYSSNGASDCHIVNGVISGVKLGIADQLAHWKVDKVHVWNFQATHGALSNGFYDSMGGVIISGCQVDCATFEVPFRFGAVGTHPSVLIASQVNCSLGGTDNSGHCVEVDSNTKLAVIGLVITCDIASRFARDFSSGSDMGDVFVCGNQLSNVVSPAVGEGMTSPGNVLAGHSAAITMQESIVPRAQMHGTNTSGSSYAGVRWSADASAPQVTLGKSRGAIGVHTVVQSGDSLGRIRFEGSDGDEFIRGAQVEAFVDGTPGNNDMPTRLVLSTTSDGASSATERMRIDSNGNPIFLPATATPPTLTVNGQITLTLTSNTNLRISARGSDGTTRVANILLA